jgi:hypothetical protein
MNDAIRREQIPETIRVLHTLAGSQIIQGTLLFDSRCQDALTGFADALAEVYKSEPVVFDDQGSAVNPRSEERNNALARKYDDAMSRIISLRLDVVPYLQPLARGWIESKQRLGDWEALRWARRGLEKGVKRPHSREDLKLVEAITVSIARQTRQTERVVWTDVQRDAEAATGRKFKSLENFNKYVVRHLSDILSDLPSRGARDRRSR